MNFSGFTPATGRVCRLALVALTVAVAGGLQAAEKWYVSDALGTTVASVNADAVVAEIESTAFGESRAPTPGTRFTGKPYDADLDAHVFPFRNYRSDAGRWTSADPSGFPDGANGQVYSPRVFAEVDPYGLKKLLWISMKVSSASDSEANALQNLFNSSYDSLVNQDAGGITRYLSDGDEFSFLTSDSFSFLSSSTINSFDKIYLVAHGVNSGTAAVPVYTNTYNIGGTIYSSSDIMAANSRIVLFDGCGSSAASGATTYAADVAGRWGMPTRNYLYE